jgi:hypothetical protein
MYIDLHIKYPLFLFLIYILKRLNSILFKDSEISNLIKNFPVNVELFHADRQTDRETDMTVLVVIFRKFANAPNFDF